MASNISLKGIDSKAQGQVVEPLASAAATLGCAVRGSLHRLGCGGEATTEAMLSNRRRGFRTCEAKDRNSLRVPLRQ